MLIDLKKLSEIEKAELMIVVNNKLQIEANINQAIVNKGKVTLVKGYSPYGIKRSLNDRINK